MIVAIFNKVTSFIQSKSFLEMFLSVMLQKCETQKEHISTNSAKISSQLIISEEKGLQHELQNFDLLNCKGGF